MRAHVYEIEGRVQGGAVWGCCSAQPFGVLVQVLFGVWRFCNIDGRVLGGMQLRVLLEECRHPGVLLEVLVCNPPAVFCHLSHNQNRGR